MAEHVLEQQQIVPRPLEEVFAFFSQAANLERLTPPWLRFEIIAAPAEMAPGARIEYRLRLHGIPIRWVTLIETWEPMRSFSDIQLRGPYRTWHHTHTFAEHPQGTLVGDRVRYSLPLGPLGDLAHALFVRRDVARVFAYRRETIERMFA